MKIAGDFIGWIISNSRIGKEREKVLRFVLNLPVFIIKGGLYLLRSATGLKPFWGQRSPKAIFFFVTNKCNQKCTHCFYASEINTSQEMLSLDKVRQICRSISGKTSMVFLCGGEPTTRPDLPEIAAEFIETAKVDWLFITSSGILQKNLLEAVSAALSSKRNFQLCVPISIDGPEDIHNAIRHYPGGYQKAMDTLQSLIRISEKDSRLVPLTTTVIQKVNANVFVDFYKFLKSTIGDRARFTFIRQDSRDAGGLDKSLLLDAGSKEDLLPPVNVCRRILSEVCAFEKTRTPFSCVPFLDASFLGKHLEIVDRHMPVASPCVAPDSFATIYPDGQVSLCEVVKPFADLKSFNYDLIRCWNSPDAGLQRKKLSKCWCTYSCALANSIMRHPQALTECLQVVKQYLR